MAKSIRNTSQSKMATPALHSIILNCDGTNSDIRKYFQIKKAQGSRVIPKPILNLAVISALGKLMETKPNDKVSVQIVIVCIEEFSSNSEVAEPWCQYYKEISELLCVCLKYIMQTKMNDRVEKTSTFKESLRILSKFCYVLTSVADKSENLSTALFNKCAENMLTLLIVKDVSFELQKVIILAVSNLCCHADRSGISVVMKQLDLRLKYVAKMIVDYPVETQMNIYNILSTSLTNNAEATEKAPTWFYKWPTLQDAFVKCIRKDFSEGCGLFLDELHQIKTHSTLLKVHQSTSKPSTSTELLKANLSCINLRCSTKNCATASPTGKYPTHNSDSTVKTSKSIECEMPYHIKSPEELSKSKTLNPKPVNTEKKVVHDLNLSNLRGLHTPFPGRHRSLSLQKQKEGKTYMGGEQPTKPTGKDDSGVFYISSLNKQSCLKQERNTEKCSLPQVKQETKFGVQNSLLNLVGEEDHSTKVKRWLTDLSAGQQDVKVVNEEVQVLHQSNFWPMKQNHQQRQLHDFSKMKVSDQKRSSSIISVEPKRRKTDFVSVTGADDLAPLTIESKSSHIKFNSMRGTPNRQEKPEQKTATKAPVNMDKEISVVFEKSNHSGSEKKVGKRPLFSKSQNCEMIAATVFTEHEPESSMPLKETVPNVISKRHWEQKVRDLDKGEMNKGPSEDIYCFHMSHVLTDPFKIPTKSVPKKKVAAQYSAKVPKTSKVSKFNFENLGSSNKENKCPKNDTNEEPVQERKHILSRNMRGIVNLKVASEEVKQRGLNNAREQKSKLIMSTFSNGTANTTKSEERTYLTPDTYPKKEEGKVKPEFYSPLLDKSMELLEPKEAHCDSEDKETKAGVQPMKQNSLNLTSSKEAMKPVAKHKSSNLEESVGLHSSVLQTPKPNIRNNQWLSDGIPKHSVNSTFSTLDSINLVGTAAKNKNGKEQDSGIEATSASEIVSVSSKEGHSKHSKQTSDQQYLKMRIQDYLRQAKEANSKMSVNQNVVAAEILEIQGLASKLSESVARCQKASSANQENLSEQSTAFEGCSKYLGPYEDQSFKAFVPASNYFNFKEFAEKIRAKNAERILKTLQSVLQNDQSSSSDSE